MALMESAVLSGHFAGQSCSERLVPLQIDAEDIELGLKIVGELVE
jgi:hypothetical protein